jgi:hypothetical protein
VHTRTRRCVPPTTARTFCRLGLKRRWVTLWAWLTRLPNVGPLPHTSHRCAKVFLPKGPQSGHDRNLYSSKGFSRVKRPLPASRPSRTRALAAHAAPAQAVLY